MPSKISSLLTGAALAALTGSPALAGDAIFLSKSLDPEPLVVASNGSEYTKLQDPPSWTRLHVKVDIDNFGGGRVKSWRFWPKIVNGTTIAAEIQGLEPYSRSENYPVGSRPKVVDEMHSTIFPTSMVEANATFMCNTLANGLRADGLSDQAIFSVDREVHFDVTVGAEAERTGLASFYVWGGDPLSWTVTCQRWTGPQLPGGMSQIDPTVFEADDILDQAEDMPIDIAGGTIVALDPPYVGQCPATANFRVVLQATGQGTIHLGFRDGAGELHEITDPGISFYNKAGDWTLDFPYTVAWEGPNPTATKEHSLQLIVNGQNKDEALDHLNTLELGHVTWASRCLPKTTVDLGGTDDAGMGSFGAAPQANAPGGLTFQPSTGQSQPVLQPRRSLQLQPARPAQTPTATFQRQPASSGRVMAPPVGSPGEPPPRSLQLRRQPVPQ
ncbi:MAG: hypothetical protein ACTS10_19255 [Kiloniellales bacterium]